MKYIPTNEIQKKGTHADEIGPVFSRRAISSVVFPLLIKSK